LVVESINTIARLAPSMRVARRIHVGECEQENLSKPRMV
jgi:hypothetical protein